MDDFTKSLGKQMNLVLKRMELTCAVRARLREARREAEHREEDRAGERRALEFRRLEQAGITRTVVCFGQPLNCPTLILY